MYKKDYGKFPHFKGGKESSYFFNILFMYYTDITYMHKRMSLSKTNNSVKD